MTFPILDPECTRLSVALSNCLSLNISANCSLVLPDFFFMYLAYQRDTNEIRPNFCRMSGVFGNRPRNSPLEVYDFLHGVRRQYGVFFEHPLISYEGKF